MTDLIQFLSPALLRGTPGPALSPQNRIEMQRASTKETIVSTLHDFGNQSPGDPTTINSMVTRAKKAIDTYTEKKLLLKKISVATLLHSLIDFAIDGGGKHYVAYAILACEEEEEPAGSLVQLAQAWLAYLLYPGECVSLHSKHSCL